MIITLFTLCPQLSLLSNPSRPPRFLSSSNIYLFYYNRFILILFSFTSDWSLFRRTHKEAHPEEHHRKEREKKSYPLHTLHPVSRHPKKKQQITSPFSALAPSPSLEDRPLAPYKRRTIPRKACLRCSRVNFSVLAWECSCQHGVEGGRVCTQVTNNSVRRGHAGGDNYTVGPMRRWLLVFAMLLSTSSHTCSIHASTGLPETIPYRLQEQPNSSRSLSSTRKYKIKYASRGANGHLGKWLL